MSESDDTDTLLLISPNYFLSDAEKKLAQEESKEISRAQLSSLQELSTDQQKHYLSRASQTMDFVNIETDGLAIKPPLSIEVPTSSAESLSVSHYDLPSDVKPESQCIIEKLEQLQFKENKKACEGRSSLENISDVSSISIGTVRTNLESHGIESREKSCNIIHSTPKFDKKYYDNTSDGEDKCVNKYSCDKIKTTSFSGNKVGFQQFSEQYQKQQQQYPFNSVKTQCTWSDRNVKQSHSLLVLPSHGSQAQTVPLKSRLDFQELNGYEIPKNEDHLISLSDMWGTDGQATAICKPTQLTLKEEQLRRQHLEKMIRLLQSRLLEYQQRISVAIEVDRAKDSALTTMQNENKSLLEELQQCHQLRKELKQQKINKEAELESVQKELDQAVALSSKFKEEKDKLEKDLATCVRKLNESSTQYKQQIEELEVAIHACKRSEELAINELHKVKDKFAKSEHLYEKSKLRCDDLEKENNTLRHQKDVLNDIQQKQKSRLDSLESQKKSLEDSVTHLTEIEVSLKRKLDLQQKNLKAHYQQQLENVVKQKLNQFQEQLDKTEETLKAEARDRERLIAERAVKQLELINEKNEIEMNLLQEKSNEEIELYRIQLENATQKIDELQLKLNLYKTKRADIAEKLHNVMEMQWQKALEIITSPNHSLSTTNAGSGENLTHNNSYVGSTENNKNNIKMNMNNICEHCNMNTPKVKKKANNLNNENSKEVQLSPVDKLQAYIELLLSKSPGDLDKLDEILLLTAKAKQIKEKFEKNTKRQYHNNHNNKPPWKA